MVLFLAVCIHKRKQQKRMFSLVYSIVVCCTVSLQQHSSPSPDLSYDASVYLFPSKHQMSFKNESKMHIHNIC